MTLATLSFKIIPSQTTLSAGLLVPVLDLVFVPLQAVNAATNSSPAIIAYENWDGRLDLDIHQAEGDAGAKSLSKRTRLE